MTETGAVKHPRKIHLHDDQWEALKREAKKHRLTLAEHFRRIVQDHLSQGDIRGRNAVRLKECERRISDLEKLENRRVASGAG